MKKNIILQKGIACTKLMRIDKPIGTLLLLWPTLWALWAAQQGVPSLKILIVFILGVFFMRAAGCVINDFADRHFDGHVERTKNRPLPRGDLSAKEAKILFAILVIFAFCLVLTLNYLTFLLSFVALFLAWIYPFMKRVTYLPQLVLGMAFGWSIPMAFAAITFYLPSSCWIIFLANLAWTMAYDTQYAMVDRDDDVKINIKSTAILFGRYDRLMIGLLQLITLALLVLFGYLNQLHWPFYAGCLCAIIFFIYQYYLLAQRKRHAYFQAFRNNNYVGLIIFIGLFASYYLHT